MLTKKLNDVSNLFTDEMSQTIFQAYVKSYFLGVEDESLDAVYNFYPTSRIPDLEQYPSDTYFVVCGAGKYGKETLRALKHAGYKVRCILDNDINKHGQYIDNIKIVSFFDFCTDHELNSNTVVIVDNGRLFHIFNNELWQLGYPQKQIYCCVENVIRNEFGNIYFDIPEFTYSEDEVFIDAGSYNGNTSKDFIKKCNNRYKKIIACEPMKEIYNKFKDSLSELHDVNYINTALSNYIGTTSFSLNLSGLQGSKLGEASTDNNLINAVRVDTIDNILQGEKATFIKMDIEGAELEALEGAHDTIVNYKPKLAISLYHKKEDLYTIPLYIHKIVPEYKFKLRHYNNKISDLVLYCYL